MVFVSGAPGAGKTSLALPLAAELGFALVCKDRLKETLHDALGAPAPDLAWSRLICPCRLASVIPGELGAQPGAPDLRSSPPWA
jgi:hypothetical protein